MPATLLLLALALVSCVVVIFPDLYWDIDSLGDTGGAVITGMGPASTAWLSTLGVAAAALGLAAHIRAGGKIDWLSTLLALAGAAACAWHTAHRADGGLLCTSWVSGVMMGLAMLHLCRRPGPRAATAAALAAMILPLAMKAGLYLLFEHPQTVAAFHAHESQFLAARGWAWGSPQHLVYLRRLEHTEVGGAFGLSNVYGSIVGAMTLVAFGLAYGPLSQWRFRRAAVPLLLAIVGALATTASQSKGAIATLLLAGFVFWIPGGARRFLGLIAVALAVLAVAAVLIRGQIGSTPEHPGELSLLVRSQYWHAAARMVEHQPWPARLLGVGPARFKDIYTLWKDPLSPEEVVSSHNIEADGLAMLGLGGGAWVVMILLWLSRAPAESLPEEPAEDDAPPSDRLVVGALAMAVVIFGLQFYFDGPALLSPEQFLGWALGAIGFIWIVAKFSSPARFSGGGLSAGLFAAGALLVIHNQIEMTFFSPGSAVVAYLVVGAAAARPSSPKSARAPAGKNPAASPLRWAAPAALAAPALWMAGAYAAPVTRQQSALASAAQKFRDRDADGAIAGLQEAIRLVPTDPGPYESYAMLLTQLAMTTPGPPSHPSSTQMFDEALGVLDRAAAAGLDDLSLMRDRVQVQEAAAAKLNDPQRLAAAITVWKELLAREPESLEDHLHLADLLWSVPGRRKEARPLYERCLRISDNSYLDPARQLPEQKIKQVRERVKPAE